MPQLSVIIATKDRPKELTDLLRTILGQSCPPLEVIIIDTSRRASARSIVHSLAANFESNGIRIKYMTGAYEGLCAARNLGVRMAQGQFILFLDDDTLLDRDVVGDLTTFLTENPKALGAETVILPLTTASGMTLADAIRKVFMLSYHKKDELGVRRSGASVLLSGLTRVISAQRLSGCGCYRREVFDNFLFDEKLRDIAYMEDLDFSYRLQKAHKDSLYVIPGARITHRNSPQGRRPMKPSVYIRTVHWFYVFFKDIYGRSVLNLMAFLWALVGNALMVTIRLVETKSPSQDWWELIYLLSSYESSFKHLRSVLRGELGFLSIQ